MNPLQKLRASQLIACCIALLLASCANSATSISHDPAASNSQAQKRIAGTWKFAGVGNPTIDTSEMPDPKKMITQTMKGTTVQIAPDGTMTAKLWDWTSPPSTFRFLSEDDQVIRFTANGAPNGDHFTYEKRRKRLSQDVKLTVNHKTGTMPAYYRRIR